MVYWGHYVKWPCLCQPFWENSNFTPIPEPTMKEIDFSKNCAWLDSILLSEAGFNYTDVWRNALPTTYQTEHLFCYADQYRNHSAADSPADDLYWLRNCPDDPEYFHYSGVPLGYVDVGFLQVEKPTPLDLAAFLVSSGLGIKAFLDCRAQSCTSVGISQDPDIGGSGVLVGYIFQTFFATMCLLSVPDILRAAPESLKFLRRPFRAHRRSIEETMVVYFGSATFFTFSIFVATIGTGAPEAAGRTLYEGDLLQHVGITAFASTHAVYSLMLMEKLLAREFFASFAVKFLTVLSIFSFSATFTYRAQLDVVCRTYVTTIDDVRFGWWAEIPSVPRAVEFSVRIIIMFPELIRIMAHGYLFIAWLYRAVVIRNNRTASAVFPRYNWNSESVKKWAWLRYVIDWKSQRISIWIVVVTEISFAWASTVFLLMDRMAMDRMGWARNQGQMSFGQILAALVWLPVVIEYIYLLMVPVAVALGGRMSTKYKVEVANDGAVSPGQASEQAETELPRRRDGEVSSEEG